MWAARSGTSAGCERVGPAPKRKRPRAAEPRRGFIAAHSGVENRHPDRAAVVVHVDHERVAIDAPLLQLVHQSADVVVDVGDHAEEFCDFRIFLAAIQILVFLRNLQRSMGSIGRQIDEKRRFALLRIDPFHGLPEKHVGAIARGLFEFSVMENRGAEIGVAGSIAATARIRLPDSAAAVDEHFIEPAAVGLIFGLIAEVPFAEDGGGVAGAFQHLGDGGGASGPCARVR